MATSPALTHVVTSPVAASLLGLNLFLQAVVIDPAANAAGFTTSNAVGVHVGTR